MFGSVLRLAHANGIRVEGRFDLSKTRKEVFDARPEWSFRRTSAGPVVYNGLFSTCINGGYYGDNGMELLGEALEMQNSHVLFPARIPLTGLRSDRLLLYAMRRKDPPSGTVAVSSPDGTEPWTARADVY